MVECPWELREPIRAEICFEADGASQPHRGASEIHGHFVNCPMPTGTFGGVEAGEDNRPGYARINKYGSSNHVEEFLWAEPLAVMVGKVLEKEIREEFEKAFKMKPSYANRYRRQWAKVFLERGKANLPGKLDAAIRDFERARRLEPGNHEAYFQLGKALTKCGKYEDALNQYEQSIAIRANNPEPISTSGTFSWFGRNTRALLGNSKR